MADAEESMAVNLGEVTRRLDRTDAEVRNLATETRAGFQALSDKLERLPFVTVAEYAATRAADQERIGRVESDLEQAQQRGHQARWALLMAALGVPLSVVASVVAAQLTN